MSEINESDKDNEIARSRSESVKRGNGKMLNSQEFWERFHKNRVKRSED
ncbi:MAG: hypothetical protein ACJAVK_000998 [Akkermansiaceae bacterium]|jgi:hypothetical protein